MKKKAAAATIDVLSHHLVPEMKVLSESEKAKMLGEFGVDEGRIPRMLAGDPEAEALKAKPGDVIRISRVDKTGKYNSYRVVSEG